MVVVGAEEVFGHIHILHPHLAVLDDGEGVHKAGLAQADGLDLCARQYKAGGEGLEQLVVERGALILYRDLVRRFLFSHDE